VKQNGEECLDLKRSGAVRRVAWFFTDVLVEVDMTFGSSNHAYDTATALRSCLPVAEREFTRGPAQVAGRSHSRRSFALGDHLRRIAIVVLSVVCRTYIPLALMGLLNRMFPAFESVFFCYAGNARYASHYSYSSCRRFLLWFPSMIGVFRQGRRWGLICAAPVTEAEFSDPTNAGNLDRLVRRMGRIKMLLGVDQVSFAGILPNVLRGRYPQRIDDYDRDHTSEVVRRAVLELRRQHFRDRDHRVVLLGGGGRIGQAVHKRLKADGIDSVVIDSAVPSAPALRDLRPISLMLVDVSRHGVIQRYIPELPAGTIVLNEVFPEPSQDVVALLKSRKIVAYHLAGVKAEVYPSLPLGYRNAVPCCAVHSDDVCELVLTRIA